MNKQAAQLLEQHFDTAFAAPDGIAKLRELILTLAMQGKLVEQDPNDPPASVLLKEIEAERKRGSHEGTKTRRKEKLPPIKPEEVPYELPQGWEWVRLGEICSYIQRGTGPKYVDFSTRRVISQKCVRWYGLDLDPARYIDPTSLKKYEPIRFLRVGDLLWNSTGTGTIGRACLVPQTLEGVEIVADSHVTVVRPIDVSPMFLWRWVQSPTVQNEIEESASGTTNQIELNTSTVINHLIPLPPLPEQDRIVARIDQLMARCDELERLRKEREEKRVAVHAAAVRQLLDAPDRSAQKAGGSAWEFIQQHFGELYTVKENVAELRKAILQLAVMGHLVPQDPNDPPASELLKEIEAEKQRMVKAGKIKKPKPLPPIKREDVPYELPQGWEWVRLGAITEYNGRKNISGDEITPDTWLLDLEDIEKGTSRILNRVKFSERQSKSTKSTFQKGDVLYGKLRPYLDKVVVADSDGVCTTEIVPIVPLNGIHSEFLRWLLKRPAFLAHVNSLMYGVKMPRLGTDDAVTSIHPLPPLPEQHRIVARIDQLMVLCDTLDYQIEAATDKRTELLNALMANLSKEAAQPSQPRTS